MKPEELEVKAAAQIAKQQAFDVRLFTCSSRGCQSADALGVITALKAEIKAKQLDAKVQVSGSGCLGLCGRGPLILMKSKTQKDVMFCDMTAALAPKIVTQVVVPMLSGSKIEQPGGDLATKTLDLNDPFFALQEFVVLCNNGKMDPEKLDEYIACGGYTGLRKALGMSAEDICKEILASGLRGRGGAGFPTGRKWELTRKVEGDVKYIICNGDEGDPGAFMDGSTLEGDPHTVIEGMLIGARAINATHGVFYIRAEYPLAVERIEKALRQARAAGLVGKNILDSGWNFDFELRLGASPSALPGGQGIV